MDGVRCLRPVACRLNPTTCKCRCRCRCRCLDCFLSLDARWGFIVINGHTVVLGLTHVFSGWALTYCEKAAKSWLRESNHAPAAQQTPPLRLTWELPRWNFVTLPDQEKNDIHVALVCNPALLPWRYKQKCSSCCLRGSISPTIHPSLCREDQQENWAWGIWDRSFRLCKKNYGL